MLGACGWWDLRSLAQLKERGTYAGVEMHQNNGNPVKSGDEDATGERDELPSYVIR